MASRIHPKLRFWRKAVLLGVVQAVFYLVILYVAKLIGFSVSTSTVIYFVALILCVSLLIPILFYRTTSFSRSNSVFNDFVHHFEDVGGQIIDNTFGFETYSRLYNEELSQMQCSGIDICRELLRRKECRDNKELEFHLRIKLAKFLVKEDRYNDAIEELRAAISIRPKDLVANFFAGENYERLGESSGAIRHYTSALNDPAAASKQIREFVESQIKRVQVKGPRKAGPQTGFRYMSH